MRRIRLLICSISFICCARFTSPAFAQDTTSPFGDRLLDSAFTQALSYIKLTPEDLTFRSDYVPADSFRLYAVNNLMRKPTEVPAKLRQLAEETLGDYSLLNTLIYKMSPFVDAALPPGYIVGSMEQGVPVRSLKDLLVRQYGGGASSIPRHVRKSIDRVGSLNESLKTSLRTMLRALDLFSSIQLIPDSSDRNFATFRFPQLLLEDTSDERRSVEEIDSLQKRKDQWAKEFPSRGRKIDNKLMLSLGRRVSVATGEALSQLYSSHENLDKGKMRDGLLLDLDTHRGKIAIGGTGPNTYKGTYQLIIDLGGDDRYELEGGPGQNQIIIDLGGNDTYVAKSDYAIASGFMGVGILIDESGDDTYIGKNFSLGSGLFGVGILWDKAGNDKYYGDQFTQGAGSFGLGALIDDGGNDQYHAAMSAQGFGFVKGAGILADRSGNDTYFAGGKYQDVLRYKDHYLSLSQGFAYGYRPTLSGGIGLLFDGQGNDLYVTDIFGQGASYWWGLGGLVDLQGNDQYISFQYAQGSAEHMTLGVLIDSSGDDLYRSKGVSQGCGHDYAAGMLLDYGGNDTYIAQDLSQGAGSANGIGILIDKSGDDRYYVGDTTNTQGYGNPRREYGSIGVLLDCLGKDRYDGNGKDNDVWIINSTWGVGVDGEFQQVVGGR